MIRKTLLTDLLVHALIEPLYHGVLNLTDAFEVSEVFFELVSVRCHAFQSVIITNIFLVWELLEKAWLPSNRGRVDDAH